MTAGRALRTCGHFAELSHRALKDLRPTVLARSLTGPLSCGIILFLGSACAPTPFIAQKHVRYDFTTEGFLSPHMLQTVGRGEGSERSSREQCLERALESAVRKAVRVMLHTKHEIPPDSGGSLRTGQPGGDAFERSYPFQFTQRDYVRGLIDYDSLLRQSYLALQDARSRTDCTVVLRLEGTDLPAKIRSIRLTFMPEGLRGRTDRRRIRGTGKDGINDVSGQEERSGP